MVFFVACVCGTRDARSASSRVRVWQTAENAPTDGSGYGPFVSGSVRRMHRGDVDGRILSHVKGQLPMMEPS